MAIVFKNKNFAKSTLLSGIGAGDLSLTVAAGHGVRFPQTGTFIAVIWSSTYTNPSDDIAREVVHCELSAGDTFTIVRAQESTLAKAWSAGDKIIHTITAGKIQELEDEIAGASGYSGFSGFSGFC